MILYVSQAKISLRRQSVIGRASDCTVCHIVPVVCLFTISRSTVFFLFAILLLYFVFAETYLSLDMFFLFLLRCRNKEQFTAAGCHSAVWHRRVDNSFFTVILCAVFSSIVFVHCCSVVSLIFLSVTRIVKIRFFVTLYLHLSFAAM